MKKLISLARTDVLASLLPILMWVLASMVYTDSNIMEVFTLTYFAQSIYILIIIIFIKAPLKYVKTNKEDLSLVYCGVIVGFICMISTTIILYLYRDKYCKMFGVDEKYFIFIIFSLICLAVDIVICGNAMILQYELKDGEAFKLTVIYHCIRLGSLAMFGLALKNKSVKIAMLMTIITLLSFAVLVMIKYTKISKIRLCFWKSIHIEALEIFPNIIALNIYFFGLSSVVSNDAIYLVAYNIAAMCSDTQWDVLVSSIETRTSIEVIQDTYDKNVKSILKSNIIYSLLLLASIFIAITIVRIFRPFDIWVAFAIIFIECSTFSLYAIKYTFNSWTVLNSNGVFLSISSTISYIVRMLCTICIISRYKISIAVLICCFCTFITQVAYYFYKRKQCGYKLRQL